MGVRVLFLGRLADLAGEGARELPAPLDWPGLLTHLGPALAAELRRDRVSVACAGQVLADRTKLVAREGEEVALLPPVSGG